jgi:branched-chain amino acid transport system ATP-binding protein
MAEVLMAAQGVSRRFGGLMAVDNVSLTLARGNGAGKSTLINLLSGELPVSTGSVALRGQDVTRWAQPRRARAGLGRSYQRNTLFPAFTVHENCRLAAQARWPRPWDWWTPASACRHSNDAAHQALQRAGLQAQAQRIAGTLSHGQKRQLEIAMCLASDPQVLLLDEPLAGMGVEESERMLALLAELKNGHAVLLVEHDMEAVFRVADGLTVMVNGRVIASGTPADVRADREVQIAYLGDGA